MNQLLKTFEIAKQDIYDHVGLEEDWVVCPLDDCTKYWWSLDEPDKRVYFADKLDDLYNREGNYYMDDIYTQRFYSKWVYRGKDFTLVMCDPHTDGMKWWRIFDNTKEKKLLI